MLGRTATVLGLATLALASSLPAQSNGFAAFKWYFGAEGGAMVFETPAQTRGAVFTAGAHLLVTARRTGLLLQVDEGIKTNQVSSYPDASAGISGQRQVIFNDLRRYQASLLAFPFKTRNVQPYLGIGFGLLQTVNEYPQGTFASSAEADAAKETANRLGSHTYASATGGVQFGLERFMAFGQYQITTAPSAGSLLTGPTHWFLAGLRISLGNAREHTTGVNGQN
jgi:hypothetical protein